MKRLGIKRFLLLGLAGLYLVGIGLMAWAASNLLWSTLDGPTRLILLAFLAWGLFEVLADDLRRFWNQWKG